MARRLLKLQNPRRKLRAGIRCVINPQQPSKIIVFPLPQHGAALSARFSGGRIDDWDCEPIPLIRLSQWGALYHVGSRRQEADEWGRSAFIFGESRTLCSRYAAGGRADAFGKRQGEGRYNVGPYLHGDCNNSHDSDIDNDGDNDNDNETDDDLSDDDLSDDDLSDDDLSDDNLSDVLGPDTPKAHPAGQKPIGEFVSKTFFDEAARQSGMIWGLGSPTYADLLQCWLRASQENS